MAIYALDRDGCSLTHFLQGNAISEIRMQCRFCYLASMDTYEQGSYANRNVAFASRKQQLSPEILEGHVPPVPRGGSAAYIWARLSMAYACLNIIFLLLSPLMHDFLWHTGFVFALQLEDNRAEQA